MADKVALTPDITTRLTIPVMVDGKGPFPFIIDTGADRTVISKELADQLALPKGPHVSLHESAGVDDVETAVIADLKVGQRDINGINAPIISAANLGAMGMLGIDSLRDQRVVMDFVTGEMRTTPSQHQAPSPDVIVVRGRSRFGQLILVDAEVKGIHVFVILDSGAQNTVGNEALRTLLLHGDADRGRAPTAEVIGVTGRTTPADIKEVEYANIGGFRIRNVPIAFSELHTFARYGIAKQPSMLLGMDVLSLCREVTIDFARREATFVLYPS